MGPKMDDLLTWKNLKGRSSIQPMIVMDDPWSNVHTNCLLSMAWTPIHVDPALPCGKWVFTNEPYPHLTVSRETWEELKVLRSPFTQAQFEAVIKGVE